MRAEITVLGGLPVTVEFTMARAEPDVGIMSDYIEEWYIVEINGRKVKNTQWVEDRIYTFKGEEEKLLDKLYDSI